MVVLQSPKRKAAFTLLEMTLVLLMVSFTLLWGSHTASGNFTAFTEEASVYRFVHLYNRAMNHSLTHQTGVLITHNIQEGYSVFKSLDTSDPWQCRIDYPPTIRMDRNMVAFLMIFDGKVSQPRTLTFHGQSRDFVLTVQMTWGRLLVK